MSVSDPGASPRLALDDQTAMALALDAARAAAVQGETPVGAVLVDTESRTVLAVAHNRPIASHDPTAHAEVLALRQAAAERGNYRVTGATLYVTLEPCAMCAAAISFARVDRVVYAAVDPKGGAVESGPRFFAQPTCHWRPQAERGPFGDEAAALLKTFFRERRT